MRNIAVCLVMCFSLLFHSSTATASTTTKHGIACTTASYLGTLAGITVIDSPSYITQHSYLLPGFGNDISQCDEGDVRHWTACVTLTCRAADCTSEEVGSCYLYYITTCSDSPSPSIRLINLQYHGPCQVAEP